MNKSKLFMLSALVVCVAAIFSSCLKDNPYMDVSNTQPIIEFGISPASGYYGPFAYAPENVTYDTTIALGDTTITPITPVNDTAIAVVLASPQVLNDTVVVTFVIDTPQIASTSAAAGFIALPDSLGGANLYTVDGDSAHNFLGLPQTVTILPGHRVGIIPVTLNFPAFPASCRRQKVRMRLLRADATRLLFMFAE